MDLLGGKDARAGQVQLGRRRQRREQWSSVVVKSSDGGDGGRRRGGAQSVEIRWKELGFSHYGHCIAALRYLRDLWAA